MFLLARLFGYRCMASKRGGRASRRRNGKKKRKKGGEEADIQISFSSSDLISLHLRPFPPLGGENVMDDCGCSISSL